MPDISDKAAAYHPHKHKTKEIDYMYFETLIFLNIEENVPFPSQDESSLHFLAMSMDTSYTVL